MACGLKNIVVAVWDELSQRSSSTEIHTLTAKNTLKHTTRVVTKAAEAYGISVTAAGKIVKVVARNTSSTQIRRHVSPTPLVITNKLYLIKESVMILILGVESVMETGVGRYHLCQLVRFMTESPISGRERKSLELMNVSQVFQTAVLNTIMAQLTVQSPWRIGNLITVKLVVTSHPPLVKRSVLLHSITSRICYKGLGHALDIWMNPSEPMNALVLLVPLTTSLTPPPSILADS